MLKHYRSLVTFWTNSLLFKIINKQISNHYKKMLINDSFTILSSNCIGGLIYHRLEKQFLTPTINMFFSQPDFVQFCIHMEWYLVQELQFIDSELPYPVAQLLGDDNSIPDITLFFNHDHDPELAREKWDDRKKRINRDNLYIILYYLDGVTVEQLKLLERIPCKNKIVLTSIPLPEVKWSLYIDPIMSHEYATSYLEKDIFGLRYYEKKFDFVSFLNE